MRGFWLALPLILVISLDVTFTLLGQPEAYWRGTWTHVNEGSPLGVWGLGMGPKIFMALMAGWILLALIASKALPGMLGQLVYGATALGHAWGSASWVPRLSRRALEATARQAGGTLGEALRDLGGRAAFGYWATLLYLVLLTLATVFCWRRAGLLPSSAPKGAKPKGKDAKKD